MQAAKRWAEADLAALEARTLRRSLEALSSPQGPEVTIGSERLINFSSNDYLGLAADPQVIDAAGQALRVWGYGAGASRLVVGDFEPHRQLEAALAQFERTEAARLFNSGYAANLAIIGALVGPGDAVFSDALNHASLIDGCRLSRAEVSVYPHADTGELEARLKRSSARRKLVVTDGVFSMDGDVAPLAQLVEVCQRHEAALLVDEAHGTGVLGNRGAGACEASGVEDRVELRMGTLSKALGGFGAYLAGPRAVTELVISQGRSLVFSTALPPSACAASLAALAVLTADAARRQRLAAHIDRFASGLCELGYVARPSSAIFPVMLGSADQALAAAEALRRQGILVKAIRPPTVPAGTSRLRFALSAAHSPEHLDRALAALRKL